MSETVIKNLPLHDECSGMANLKANLDARRRRELRWIDATATFCIGMVLGALLVTGLFLLTHLTH